MSGDLVSGAELRRATQRRFDRVASNYERVNRLLAFGMDQRWRRQAAAALDLPAGSTVLDVGCGTGGLTRELRARGMRTVGFDLSEAMLRVARSVGENSFAMADALHLPVADERIDGLCCAFALRDVGEPARLLGEFSRVLRPGGKLMVLEVASPRSSWARAVHRVYFRRVAPAIGGMISDREAYRAFADSMDLLPSATLLAQFVDRAGFVDSRRRTLDFGAVQVLTANRR